MISPAQYSQVLGFLGQLAEQISQVGVVAVLAVLLGVQCLHVVLVVLATDGFPTCALGDVLRAVDFVETERLLGDHFPAM